MPSPIQSTRRPPFPAHRPSDETLNREQTLHVGFQLRAREEQVQATESLVADHAAQLPHERRHLEDAEIATHFGTDPEQIDEVASAVQELGLEIVDRDASQRTVYAQASLAQLEKALGIEFYLVQRQGLPFRTFDGPVHLPENLSSQIAQVTGLDAVPVPSPRSHVRQITGDEYAVRQVAELYDFPLDQRGAGQTAVIIMLGGGYHTQDLDDYFAAIDVPRPEIVDDSVGGATNQPASSATMRALFKSQGFDVAPAPGHDEPEGGSQDLTSATWTLEATTDVEILGSLLPEARLVVIFAPNTQDDQAKAMQRALSEDFAKSYGRPSVISCSWGQYEYTMRASSREQMETHLQRAVALGVTVCFSSGDVGGGFVYYPTSSQYVLSCGGTSILALPDAAAGKPLLEEVWREQRLDQYFSSSSGGLSSTFAAPSWQAKLVQAWGAAQRGVPDVAGHASIESGYSLIIGGVEVGVGGTSAVAPLMAGLVGQINGANADLADGYRVGWLTPLLYEPAFRAAFRPIEEGSNGLYCPRGPWNPCTGLGRPIGKRLAQLLRLRSRGKGKDTGRAKDSKSGSSSADASSGD